MYYMLLKKLLALSLVICFAYLGHGQPDQKENVIFLENEASIISINSITDNLEITCGSVSFKDCAAACYWKKGKAHILDSALPGKNTQSGDVVVSSVLNGSVGNIFVGTRTLKSGRTQGFVYHSVSKKTLFLPKMNSAAFCITNHGYSTKIYGTLKEKKHHYLCIWELFKEYDKKYNPQGYKIELYTKIDLPDLDKDDKVNTVDALEVTDPNSYYANSRYILFNVKNKDDIHPYCAQHHTISDYNEDSSVFQIEPSRITGKDDHRIIKYNCMRYVKGSLPHLLVGGSINSAGGRWCLSLRMAVYTSDNPIPYGKNEQSDDFLKYDRENKYQWVGICWFSDQWKVLCGCFKDQAQIWIQVQKKKPLVALDVQGILKPYMLDKNIKFHVVRKLDPSLKKMFVQGVDSAEKKIAFVISLDKSIMEYGK